MTVAPAVPVIVKTASTPEQTGLVLATLAVGNGLIVTVALAPVIAPLPQLGVFASVTLNNV